MDAKDYIQICVILVTLIVALINLIFSYVTSKKNVQANVATAEKNRLTSITSARRKERMEKIIEMFSKIAALSHPATIKAYAKNADKNFPMDILINFENINMLLGLNFQKDVELVSCTKPIVENAINHYEKICKGIDCENDDVYSSEYYANIRKAKRLFSIYIITDWGRLKQEAKTGEEASPDEWFKRYAHIESWYDKWNVS